MRELRLLGRASEQPREGDPSLWDAWNYVGTLACDDHRDKAEEEPPGVGGDEPGYSGGMSRDRLVIVPAEAPGTYVLRGEIDLETAPQITEISARRNRTIILDFTEVTFIDSIGIWAIVNLVRGPDGGTLVIKNPSEKVKRTFDLVDLADTPGIIVE